MFQILLCVLLLGLVLSPVGTTIDVAESYLSNQVTSPSSQ